MSNKIEKGFDRDIDYEPMKDMLIKEFIKQSDHFINQKYIIRAGRSIIYLLISMIQLRNGSRISEAINAFKLFIEKGIDKLVIVKIAKSGGIKYKYVKCGSKTTREKYTTKVRYRKMMFPETWLDKNILKKVFDKLKITHDDFMKTKIIRQKILNFMLRHFSSNTHSLRYAFINHMLHDKKTGLNEVAKFVGHANVGQLVKYTQQKKCDEIFNLDM